MKTFFFRRRALTKIALIVIMFFVIILYLGHSSLDKKKKMNHANWSIDKLSGIDAWLRLSQDHVIQAPPMQNDTEGVGKADADSVNPDNHVLHARMKHGQAAVFKDGIFGNYEPTVSPKITKPGENGEPVHTSMEEQARADATVREFGFNMVTSEKVAMNRSLPDTRMQECKYWHYPESLPTASVILVFFDEGWSTLVRTVHSVINTSPTRLLHEVVLIDDGSEMVFLKDKLEQYIKQWHGKVKLYRNPERVGLIQARNRGANVSTGDVIIFLDAHCECNRNWLVPLLARITYDRTILAVPIVDGINWNTLEYRSVYDNRHHRGIFEWGFLYKESLVPEKELATRRHNSEPYKSPTHAGGLFAIDRKYFLELGGYDPGLLIWGGENYELAFKVWMCGGSSEWVPCSRVGHIYRGPRLYSKKVKMESKTPFTLRNYMRVVEVWMDEEHKEYYYTREPMGRGADIGNISRQLQFKKDHHCKSFKWFMENVAYEVYDKFPTLPANKAWGEVREKHGIQRCWDTLNQGVGGGPIGVYFCHGAGGNQQGGFIGANISEEECSCFPSITVVTHTSATTFRKYAVGTTSGWQERFIFHFHFDLLYQHLFRINTQGQLGLGERCIQSPNGDTLHVQYCDIQPTGPWEFDEMLGQIKHASMNKCVQVGAGSDNTLRLMVCDPDSTSQQWVINKIYSWKSCKTPCSERQYSLGQLAIGGQFVDNFVIGLWC